MIDYIDLEKKDSPMCMFCKTEVESVKHLFRDCYISQEFWSKVKKLILDMFTFNTQFDWKQVFLNNVAEPINNAVNTLILLAKFTIYRFRCSNSKPILRILENEINVVQQIELQDAQRKNIVWKYNVRWNQMSKLVTLTSIW